MQLNIRPQYHLRKSKDGLLAWQVTRLIELVKDYPVEWIAIASIAELDEPHWYLRPSQVPTCRSLLEHMALVDAADLSYPIIVDSGGRVMDGMHRVCKAVRVGRHQIAARRFPVDPEPDFTGVEPDDLPYGE
ncbi:MAG: hypothetical protein AAFU77_10985 [Myxococcota bacterium]